MLDGDVRRIDGATCLATPGGQYTTMWPLNPRVKTTVLLERLLSSFSAPKKAFPKLPNTSIHQGADPSLTDPDGRTATSVAKDPGHQAVIVAIT